MKEGGEGLKWNNAMHLTWHTPGLTAHNHFSSSQQQTNKPNYKHQQFLNDLIFSSRAGLISQRQGLKKGVSRKMKFDLQDLFLDIAAKSGWCQYLSGFSPIWVIGSHDLGAMTHCVPLHGQNALNSVSTTQKTQAISKNVTRLGGRVWDLLTWLICATSNKRQNLLN